MPRVGLENNSLFLDAHGCIYINTGKAGGGREVTVWLKPFLR